jgi:regulator of RNase E activity RraA
VADGVIRDLAEVRAAAFPVFARGIIPIPGAKSAVEPLNTPVRCGGVTVHPGDIIVADEEGIVAIPVALHRQVLLDARAKSAKEAAESLDDWEQAHRTRIDQILTENGFEG